MNEIVLPFATFLNCCDYFSNGYLAEERRMDDDGFICCHPKNSSVAKTGGFCGTCYHKSCPLCRSLSYDELLEREVFDPEDDVFGGDHDFVAVTDESTLQRLRMCGVKSWAPNQGAL